MVDWTRCNGHGLCAHLVPEVIHLDAQGYPVILNIPVPAWLEKDAQQAVHMCPALALRLSTSTLMPTRSGPVTIPSPPCARAWSAAAAPTAARSPPDSGCADHSKVRAVPQEAGRPRQRRR